MTMDTIVVILLTLAPCPCHRQEAPKPRQEHKIDWEAVRRAANDAAREATEQTRHLLPRYGLGGLSGGKGERKEE